MHNAVTRSYDLTALGVRAYFTPGRDNDTPEESEFSYYSHSHPYYELHLIRNGSVVLQTGSLRHNLNQDTFCLICPDISHGLKSSVLGVRRCCIGLTITDVRRPAAGFLLAQTRTIPGCTGNSLQLLPVLERLLAEDRTSMFSEEMTGQLLSQLVLQMLRALQTPLTAVSTTPRDLNALRTVHIDEFLNNHFHLQGAQQKLADELGLSRRQLDRVFQNLYGMCFREKILQIRLDAACDLLEGDMPIGQIALQLGYSNSANFTVFFRSAKGMTPSEFRKNLKNH